MKIKQYKIARRLGSRIFPKTENPKFVLTRKKQTAKKRPKQLSEYGSQLLEKQKAHFTYGLREKQLSRYVKESIARKGKNPLEELNKRLESRLDNVVFRLGFAQTRRHARQMVSHGHLTVNGRKMTIPSYEVRVGDTIGIRAGSRNKALFGGLEERLREHKTPPWLTLDFKHFEGKIIAPPVVPEQSEAIFSIMSIIEFYSR